MSVIIKSVSSVMLVGTLVPSFCPSYVAVEQVHFESPGSSTSGSSGDVPEVPTSSIPPLSEAGVTGDGVEGSGSGNSGSTASEDATVDTNSSTDSTTSSGANDETCDGDGCDEEMGCMDHVPLDNVRYFFVSDMQHKGPIGKEEGWSCGKEAEAACLPGKYAIWRSEWETSDYDGCWNPFEQECSNAFEEWLESLVDPNERWLGPSSYAENVNYTGKYLLPGDCGEECLIAYGWSDLTDGELARPINRTATGAEIMVGDVWSNVSTNGSFVKLADDSIPFGTDCGQWTAETGWGNVGKIASSAGSWTYQSGNALTCSNLARVYCYQIGG